MLQIGKIYWLEFPGIAARVIKAPDGLAPSSHPNLMFAIAKRLDPTVAAAALERLAGGSL